jgi:cysteine desulfurase / selenocysteine lyase
VTIDDRFAELRAHEFPEPGRAIHLNAAGFGVLPERTRSALNEFNNQRHRSELRDSDLFPLLPAAREQAARLIGAHAHEIALTPNTQVAINIAANAVRERVHDRDTILLSNGEFPANVYPWLALQHEGFNVELIDTDAGGLPREADMLERIERGDVAAVSISFVQFSNGYRMDMDAFSRVCAATDTLLVVDAIQGLGAVPLDVSITPVDILACGAQKWLCSPWGSGFTYVREGLIDTFEPTYPGWLSFKSSTDFRSLTSYEYELLEDGRRFEVGSIAYQDHLGMARSIELLLELGVEEIWQHGLRLQQPIIDWAYANGTEIVSDLNEARRSGILGIKPGNAATAHVALLDAGVVCALRENAIRLSPHWYNTTDEIYRMIEILDAVTA